MPDRYPSNPGQISVGAVHRMAGDLDAVVNTPGAFPTCGPPPTLWARITNDAAIPGQYDWQEQWWDADANAGKGGWVHPAQGRSSNESGFAIEAQGFDAVAIGQVVHLEQIPILGTGLYWSFASPRQWIWVKLTGAAPISPNQWWYGGTRQARSASGWADFTPALTITAVASGTFLNAMEANNSGSGVQGNGVNHTSAANGGHFPNGFAMQPVAAGAPGFPVVQAWRDRLADGTLVWTLQSPNGDDGACS